MSPGLTTTLPSNVKKGTAEVQALVKERKDEESSLSIGEPL